MERLVQIFEFSMISCVETYPQIEKMIKLIISNSPMNFPNRFTTLMLLERNETLLQDGVRRAQLQLLTKLFFILDRDVGSKSALKRWFYNKILWTIFRKDPRSLQKLRS